MKKEFRIKNNFIIFFCVRHSKDREQIKSIRKEIDNFGRGVVLVEGSFHIPNFPNEEIAIQTGGEMGFASFYSKRKGLKVLSNDPSSREGIAFIVSEFGKDIAFLYFVLKEINQNLRLNKKTGKADLQRSIRIFKSNTNWKGFDYNPSHFMELFKEVVGKEYSFSTDYTDLFNPHCNRCKLNSVSRSESEFRDEFMIKVIKEVLKEHNRILIFKGKGHLEFFNKRIPFIFKNG